MLESPGVFERLFKRFVREEPKTQTALVVVLQERAQVVKFSASGSQRKQLEEFF